MKKRTSGLAILIVFFAASFAIAQQTLFLDFDSGTDGSINYTNSMRDAVVSQLQTVYGSFNISVTKTAPVSGPFSTVTFNSGGAGGVAEDIDFRNLNQSDNAVVNADGFGLTTTSQIISASANLGAHESGHLFGLRHHDSFGPIGTGISSGTSTGSWLPTYTGPQGAVETNNHTMASPASVGSALADLLTPSWLSERSAIKLTYAEQGALGAELVAANDTLATAQAFNFENFVVPNTILSGANSGLGDFDVDAHVLLGRLDNASEIDIYRFDGFAGDLINIEIISNSPNRFSGDSIDPEVSVFDANGDFVDYFGVDAFNDDELENQDAQILDLVLASDGEYFVQINAFGASDTGDYEMFISRFNGVVAVPEPAGWLVIVGFSMILRRRKVDHRSK